MSDLHEERELAVSALLETSRVLLGDADADRATLQQLLLPLKELAARPALWDETSYPAPAEGELQNRYRIGGETGDGLMLYLNVMRPGKQIPPHNHTTWACIAAVEGTEINRLYRRLDDGREAGKADLELDETINLGPGTALAMLGSDIHSVEIPGDQPIRHLHFYGRPLESLTERITFDLEAGTCRPMSIGVKTKSVGQ